ncbi:hypothetical protein EYF80_055560 [Liparis tanakae]|uniref:Uncharacterized protein n=1 Tax=Liparis tanakae TaxID=230148 RepID=A0A4Z2EZ88_9TELE|nr:hypothetical protein EYF80_055560 [Liparis tanakae]
MQRLWRSSVCIDVTQEEQSASPPDPTECLCSGPPPPRPLVSIGGATCSRAHLQTRLPPGPMITIWTLLPSFIQRESGTRRGGSVVLDVLPVCQLLLWMLCAGVGGRGGGATALGAASYTEVSGAALGLQ